ncbi:MAG: toll/interleukin-1 receptor domain-containing protein [Clostridia bacterium]|nr:toll/interleukin-1 receptor domain-containing protein [Clostridia bacterium]
MIDLSPYTGNQPYIYISFDAKDAYRAKSIIEDFAKYQNFRIWFADAYTSLEQRAEKIQNCTAFLSCISKNSIQSETFKQELNFAIEMHKNPMILFFEEVELSLGMRMRLGTFQAIYGYRHQNSLTIVEELCRTEAIASCEEGYVPGPRTAENMSADACAKKGSELLDIGETEEALIWLEKAAEKGHLETMYRLGQIYARGDRYGFESDYVESVKWHRMAAEKGHYMAQGEMGYHYYEGTGVEKNVNEAIRWWKLSAAKGFPPAIRMLKSLGIL